MLRIGTRNFGTALNFTGTGSFVDATTLGTFGSTKLTGTVGASIWFKTSQQTTGTLFGTVNTGSSTLFALSLNRDSTDVQAVGKIQLIIRNTTATFRAATTNIIPYYDNSWHNLTISTTPATNSLALYYDGVSQTVTVGSAGGPTTFPDFGFSMYVGARNLRGTADQLFRGSLDNLYINTVGYSQTDATNIYQAGFYSAGSSYLVYLFDEGSGTSTTDSSGNGYTGTITNASYTAQVVSAVRSLI